MSEAVVKSNAEDSKPAVEKKPMTEADFLASRVAKHAERMAPKEPKPKQLEPEPKRAETEAEVPTQEGAKDEAKPDKAVLSKDVDELTDEEIAELAEKGKSGLLKRVAELTAKRKLAEEKAAQLEAAMRQQQQQVPQAPKVENNPFKDISNPEELSNKDKTYREIVKWAERVLDEAEGSMPDDIVANENGQQYTKRQLKQVLRNAREARDEYIPARYRELQEETQRAQAEQALSQRARQELNWLEDKDNEVRKRYEAVIGSPLVEKIKKAVPEAMPTLNYVFAHATNSIYGRREIGIETKPVAKSTLTPPSSPTTAAAASEKPAPRETAKTQEIESRFKKTGSTNDWVALRAQKLSTRKTVKL